MKILLLSAYDAASHRRWYQTLMAAFTSDQWTVLSLPARYFSWRIRGNSLSWAFDQREILEQDYDLLIATSMVDLSALRGFVPSLATIPTLVYFHENQFAYPDSGQQYASVEPKILNLYTALAADTIAFNSIYNRDSFLQGAEQLLAKMPDRVPAGIVERLGKRCCILPVPIESDCFRSNVSMDACSLPAHSLLAQWRCCEQYDSTTMPSIKIVWNHRHEHDKGADRLLAIFRELEGRGIDYAAAVLGEQFRNSPPELAVIQAEFSHRLAHFGFVESVDEYRMWLGSADIALSTSCHEFQGLSVLEAIAAGCVPVLPNRLVYPEIVSEEYLYKSFDDDIAAEAVEAVNLLINARHFPVPTISRFSLDKLKADYEVVFEQTKNLR